MKCQSFVWLHLIFVYICVFHLARSNNKSTFNVISYENLENRFLFFFFWKASMSEWGSKEEGMERERTDLVR